MESLKSIFHNMSDTSKMLIKILVGIIIGLVVIVILALILRLVVGRKKDYSSIEQTMQSAAVKYYKKHDQDLPEEGQEAVVTTENLIQEEYMKEMEKYVGKDITCSGNVTVVNNDDNYAYIPYLDCGEEYKTSFLVDTILENNAIVDSGDGLYLDDAQNYVFRGEYVNNYAKFGDLTYRILKINNDGTIRLFLNETIKSYKRSSWDDRYNIDRDANTGINDYSIRRIKDYLETIYEDEEIFSSSQKALMVKQDLCIGGRSENSEDLSHTAECSKIEEDQNLGLLQVNEFVLPSIDANCKSIDSRSCLNYNYMTELNYSFWSQTPVIDNSYEVYRIATSVYTARAANSANILFTLHLSSKTQIKDGSGTLDDPYIINIYSE